MPLKSGYDVIKMLEKGTSCHVVMDHTRGNLLINHMSKNPKVTKELLFQWFREIAKQLELFHRHKENPYYQYLNPYNIIITKEQKLYLLDLKAKNNEVVIHTMQQQSVHKKFMSQRRIQKSKIELDIYSMGKTIQFILAKQVISPKLSKKEESHLSKIISKCLETNPQNQYHKIKEIIADLPHYRTKNKKNRKLKWIATIMFFVIVLGVFLGNYAKAKLKQEAVSLEKNTQQLDNHQKLNFEMGFVQFAKLQEYEKSEGYFQKANLENEIDKSYLFLSKYLQGNKGEVKIKEVEKVLHNLEQAVNKSMFKEDEKILHLLCVLRTYTLLEEDVTEHIIRIGEACKKSEKWKLIDEELNVELNKYLAFAYDTNGEIEAAISGYQQLITVVKNEQELEQFFLRLVELYTEDKNYEKAREYALQGITGVEDSLDLPLQYIRILCQDNSVDRELGGREIKRMLEQKPELTEQETFKKLQQEYAITIDEGGVIWIGK